MIILPKFFSLFSDHIRYKRQFDDINTPEIDLNITVPYIFSARLYPYGISRGDRILSGSFQLLKLRSSLKFLGEIYNSVYIRRDGIISFTSANPRPSRFPINEPVIAVYWMSSQSGKVYFRETDVLNLAQNEVNIQYRYGSSIHPTSVLIVTWENVHDAAEKSTEANTANSFQIAIIISELGTFAHVVYSKLNSNNDAIAGFNGKANYYSLPGSGTHDAILLSEKSDIGIPGEFLFRIDMDQVFLCGAGFKGLECIEGCGLTEWGLDCSHRCHCEGSLQCNPETGVCPNGRCNPGWIGEPICDQDINECEKQADLCPHEQPDCMNTAGAYLCVCFEYDNSTNSCKASWDKKPIPVPVISLEPKLATFLRAASTAFSLQPETLSTFHPINRTEQATETIRFNSVTIRNMLCLTILSIFTFQPVLGTTKPPCHCGINAECINGICQCKSGWAGDGKFCVDINECFGEPSICGPHSACENSAGSYSCQCDIGYISDENGKCMDMDECAEGVVICGGGKNSSVCVNIDGGYECRCAPGYTGNPDSPHGCVDVDECQLSEFYCGERGLCKNLIGSYECTCDEGFQRDPQSGQCVDTDECRYDPCDKAALCSNLYGSFKCSCIDGFVGNGVECHETILYPVQRPTLYLLKKPNSVADFSLPEPIQLFGKQHSTIYISSNGGVSFDSPLPNDAFENSLSTPAFFPLSQQYIFDKNSNVILKIITDTDAQDYPLLARSSLSVHTRFHQKDFRARNMIIISYEKMINSFQLVISRGANATFLTYLFEEVESEFGFSGFSSGSTLFELPLALLVNQSNIGERGKWMFRIDSKEPLMCPAGTLDPPLCQKECGAGFWGFECKNKCHCKDDIPCDFATGYCSNAQCATGWIGTNCFQDIDECFIGLHNCTDQLDCINEIGTFRCRFFFLAQDPCFEKYKEKCSIHAKCDGNSEEGPECICNNGYHGDGLNCFKIINTPTGNVINDGSLSIPERIDINEEEVEVTPFVMHNWITEVALSIKIKFPHCMLNKV
ncbi:unnamed protein product [Dracunculus medinensis]|uniref:EGF-like domain-containing protein n=1 Tax=Dracunculus medinensis TaxID=318479 RepID=A0A3P7SM22_DRAME|nr:unnamed protein product [Dracunculus medinensis]